MTTHGRNDILEEENVWIPLSDEVQLAARIWRPADSDGNPVPAILEYLPYRKRDGTAVRDEKNHPYFARHGYACIRVDMRGSGESDGLMYDEYAPQEQADALEVIDWITAQPWCSGAVGMIGISWGGFNGLQVAYRQPEALKAVVSIATTTDRYADDIHYKGGCMLVENFGWSQQMLSYMSRPPDPDLVGDRWREIWLRRLENMPHFAEVWMGHQQRDDYWKHGSICEDWSAVKAPVLVVGGLADGYINAVMNILEKLEAPRKGILGPWVHLYPNFGVPGPQIGFLQEALRWWDRWLKGIDTGVENDPDLRVFRREGVKPAAMLPMAKGHWVSEPQWPSPNIGEYELYLAGRRLVPEGTADRREMEIDINSPQDVGAFGGEYFAWIGPDQPDDQRSDDAKSVVWDTVPLEEAVDILGRPAVRLRLKVDAPQAILAVRLCDVTPMGPVMRVSYTVFNLSQRKGPDAPEAMPVGEWVDVEIPLDNTCHRFLPGHRIRLSVSTAYWPLIWPSPTPVTVTVDNARSSLVLPARKEAGQPEVRFAAAEMEAPVLRTEHRASSLRRNVTYDLAAGSSHVEIDYDNGDVEDSTHGLRTSSTHRERYDISPDDPLSARMEVNWTQKSERDYWETRTETGGVCRATANSFELTAHIVAYEGDEKMFERRWQRSIPRKLV